MTVDGKRKEGKEGGREGGREGRREGRREDRGKGEVGRRKECTSISNKTPRSWGSQEGTGVRQQRESLTTEHVGWTIGDQAAQPPEVLPEAASSPRISIP